MLCLFKYTNFIINNFNSLFTTSLFFPHILLPLALSFFTFQQIGFLIDCHKENSLQNINFLDYLLFISFFPQLIAGPILHHKEMMPQFHKFLRNSQALLDWNKFAKGLFIFSIGLFKKVVIADTFAIWANAGFNTTKKGIMLDFLESWATSLSYTFQIYFDFSGYCDMAIGLGLFFGIVLPINFNSPYQALNIQVFWKKWHITLGKFLTQYLYIPLGGSLKGKNRTLLNLMIVFILSGIWHGAGWGFVIWGVLHGIAMVIHRIYCYLLEEINHYHLKTIINKFRNHLSYKFLAWLITFNFINLCWVFFRSENLNGALLLFQGMLGKGGIILPSALEKITQNIKWINNLEIEFGIIFKNISPSEFITPIFFLSHAFLLIFSSNSLQNSTKALDKWYWNIFCAILFVFALFQMNAITYQPQFLYFNF